MPSTLAEIAKRAGVSLATASRVLNGDGKRPVAARLREQVLAAAEEVNYVPNAHAQALARSESTAVGAIVHDVSDPYFSEIVRGIQRVAADAGRLVTICNSYRDPARELEYVRLLRSQRVGAIIMTGSGLDDRNYSQSLAAQIQAFADFGGRTIFIGRHHVAGDAVIPDNVGGARLIGDALLDLGHREIGVISGPDVLTTTRDRLDGLRQALSTRHVVLDEKAIVAGDFSRDSGVAAARELWRRNKHMTALAALNDEMAIGAMSALRELQIDVPGRVSVIGFDDIPAALDVTPSLSTIRIPLIEMGARAMNIALQPASSHLTIEHFTAQLVLRESTRKV
jgi:LacI family transcriptional regulator